MAAWTESHITMSVWAWFFGHAWLADDEIMGALGCMCSWTDGPLRLGLERPFFAVVGSDIIGELFIVLVTYPPGLNEVRDEDGVAVSRGRGESRSWWGAADRVLQHPRAYIIALMAQNYGLKALAINSVN